ncbi:hypothetical protein BG004_004442 [Podila humilis]|nr:hypothetical protein BG004_004442 [Podila humilis]
MRTNAGLDICTNGSTLPSNSDLSKPDRFYSFTEYIEKVIPDAGAVRREFPGQTEFLVTAIDPGAKKTACSVTIDTTKPEHATMIGIPRESLGFAENLHRKRLEYAKKTTISGFEGKNINGTEEEFRQFKLPPPPRSLLSSSTGAFNQSKEDTLIREKQSRAFCGRHRFTTSQSTIGNVSRDEAYLQLGTASLDLHMEYMTSPGKRQGSDGKRTDAQNAKFCLDPNKGPMSDRDHNAALNLARASLQQVQEQTWPVFLQRKKKIDLEEEEAAEHSAC